MGRRLALLVIVACSACARRKDPEPIVQAAPPIACPDGAEVHRGPEPAGWWCGAYDEIGRLVGHGTRWELHGSGTVAERHAARMGTLHGDQWMWREDGTVYQQGQWSNGLRTGWWMELSTDRTLRAEGPMVEGRRNGVWTETDLTTGQKVVGPWVDGRRSGTFVDLIDGRVVRERTYRDDRLLHVRAR